MKHEEFKTIQDLIESKNKLQEDIENLQRQISDINTNLYKPVQELFRPYIGRYFCKSGNSKDWFIITEVPHEHWMLIGGCTFDENHVPAKIMGSDGMPRIGLIGIAPEKFCDDGLKLPEYIVEVSEDEWFSEQRRRVHAEADRKLKEAMSN